MPDGNVVVWLPSLALYVCTEMILGLLRANERRRYFVARSLIGWAQT